MVEEAATALLRRIAVALQTASSCMAGEVGSA